jgi:hypothetical protein
VSSSSFTSGRNVPGGCARVQDVLQHSVNVPLTGYGKRPVSAW